MQHKPLVIYDLDYSAPEAREFCEAGADRM